MTIEAFTAGGLTVDNVVAADGALYRNQMGGNAAYSAAGARLWLDRVGIVGVIPVDYPVHWLDRLRAGGLATDGISIVDETVTCCEWFFYGEDGSRRDYLYADPDTLAQMDLGRGRLSPEAAAQLQALLRDRVPLGRSYGAFRRDHPVTAQRVPPRFLGARGVHLAPNRADAQLRMADALGDGSRIVTLDPGANAEAVARHMDDSALTGVDALLPSEKELAAMVPGASRTAALAWLMARGASAAAVKLGSVGALVQADAAARPVLVPALPITARDPTGAGDAFCGGFLAGLIRSGHPVVAACCGTVSASFAVEAPGPFHLLKADRGEAARRMALVRARLPATADVPADAIPSPSSAPS